MAMPMSTLMRRPVRRMAMAAGDVRRDAQAEGRVVLRADGNDPQGGACTGQDSGHGRNGAVATADHEHPDPLRQSIPDRSGQVAARFDQEGFRHELPSLHLVNDIQDPDGRSSGCACAGIEDQLGAHVAIVLRTRFFGMDFLDFLDFLHTVLSFGRKLIGRQSRLQNGFGFRKQLGKPLHAAGHQGQRRFIHCPDGRPYACLPLLQVGNLSRGLCRRAVADEAAPQDLAYD